MYMVFESELTVEPTQHPIMCRDYQISIIFKLLGFIKENDWESMLTALCGEAFTATILYLLTLQYVIKNGAVK